MLLISAIVQLGVELHVPGADNRSRVGRPNRDYPGERKELTEQDAVG